jgi:TRAP-type C4-dicarboxylate transport system substrate-binding protein
MKLHLSKMTSGIIVGATLALSTTSTANAEAKLRFNRWLPPSHFLQKVVLNGWMADVARVTEGRVKAEVTAAGVGGPKRQYQVVADGIVDVGWIAHGYTPGEFPLTEFVELPFLGQSGEAISVAYWNTYNKFLLQAKEHRTTHLVTLHTHPAGHVYNKKRAISSMADFKGLKIRANNRTTSKFLKSVGATPLFMPVTTMGDGLAKGVLDGTVFTDEAFVNFRIQKQVKYALKFPGGLYNTSFAMIMNKDAWSKISAKDQAAISKISGVALARNAGREWDRQETMGQKTLAGLGVQTVRLEGKFLELVRKKVSGFEKDWIKAAAAKNVDGAAVLKYFRKEIADYPKN